MKKLPNNVISKRSEKSGNEKNRDVSNFFYKALRLMHHQIPHFVRNDKRGPFGNSIRSFLNDNRGFTLIEIIMVIIFLSVALLATMNMMSTSMSGSMNVEFINTSANLANEKMEQIFADKKSQGYGYIIENNYPDETNVNGFTGFNRYVEITTQSTDKKIEVRVTHSDIEDCVFVAYITNY